MKWLILLSSLLLGLQFNVAFAQTNVPRFEPITCPFEPKNLRVECGYLIVPEDHSQSNGQTIRLMVAILHSSDPHPLPDPVLVLVGGPGGAAVDDFERLNVTETALHSQRDIIYLDQRGTGQSEPRLDCPEFVNAFLTPAPLNLEERLITAISACRDRLVAAGIDLTAYTSAQSAADVAALREVLGYEQWNLWGTSYGTRLALTVMRDHPTGIRSVILDAAYPPNVNLYLETAANTKRALNTLFEKCAADFLCNLAYPNLGATYDALFDRLNTNPAAVAIKHPVTGENFDFRLDGYTLSDGVMQLLYSANNIRYLPAIIDSLARGDFEILLAMGNLLPTLGGISDGMNLSVQCSEEAPFTTLEAVIAAEQNISQYNRLGSTVLARCEHWLNPVVNPLENEPVVSDIPTLILAGEYDPITPPAWGKLAAETLPNSYFYEFPEVGHGTLGEATCPNLIMTAFLDNPQVAPDDQCIEKMGGISFIVTLAATRPWAQAGAGILGFLAVGLVGVTGWSITRHAYSLAWKNSLHLVGWQPALATAAILGLLLLVNHYSDTDTRRLVEIIVPLVIAIQAAFVFSAEDEPAQEIQLACPRPPAWILLERLLMIFALQTGVALGGTIIILLITENNDLLLALTRWIPTAILLGGIAIYTTIRSRLVIFGVAVTIIIWFTMVFLGDNLLPGQTVPAPLHYIQPLVWIIQPYLKPESLSDSDYLLNRLAVTFFGINLLMLAVRQMQNEERLLLGSVKKQRKDS